jgi:glycosyltransferase 2 family protein
LHKQDAAPLAVAAIAVVLQILAGGERWRLAIAGLTPDLPQPSAASVHAAFYVGVFFNCFPLGNVGGDLARIILVRKFDLPFGLKVMSILVDHALAVLAPIAIAALTLLTIDHPAAKLAWLAAAGILLATAIGVYLLNFIEHVLGRWAHQRVVHLVLRLGKELHALARRREIYIALLFAMLSSACSGFAAYCIARSLGIEIGLLTLMGVMSIVTLISVLPISLAGWGVREVSVVTLLGMLGVDQAPALLLSIEFGLLAVLMSLPGGMLWMFVRGRPDLAKASHMK